MQRKFPIYGQVVERFEITRDLGLLIDSELKYTENVKVALTERHMKEVTECYWRSKLYKAYDGVRYETLVAIIS